MMKTVTTDQKRRVVLPNSEPGEVYQVREVEGGHFELTKLVPASRIVQTPEELRDRMRQHGLTPKMRWETLRESTREW